MLRIHHRVVKAIAHRAHPTPCRLGCEFTGVDLLDRHGTCASLGEETPCSEAESD